MAILQSTENPQAIAQLQSIKPSTQIFFWTYDVTMAREEMKKYFDEVMVQMDYIDVLINGATLCDESDIDATIHTNLTGMMNTVATVLPYMDRKMGGSGGLIVNVTSVIGLDPSPVFCAYSASKFGVIGFTRSLAVSVIIFCVLFPVSLIFLAGPALLFPKRSRCHGRVLWSYQSFCGPRAEGLPGIWPVLCRSPASRPLPIDCHLWPEHCQCHRAIREWPNMDCR